jgi:sarcosine oxidase subunit gamma
MADSNSRSAPVPAEPAVFDGVRISLGVPLARYSLRGRDPKALGGLIDRTLPEQIGTTEGDVACLGPDEWLLRAADGTRVPDGSGMAMSVVEISARAVTLVLDGPRAEQVLQAGCPRDLGKFAIGEARRTLFEGVELVLLRTAGERFEVDVWRSFAAHLHLALITAASHPG